MRRTQSDSDPRVTQTGPEGWGWAGNTLQAWGSPGHWILVSQSVRLRVLSRSGLPWGPGVENSMEVLGTPL